MEPETRLAEMARHQWGVFSREQALEAGLSVWSIHRRLAAADWVEVCRRVYRHTGGHASWHQSVRAATLSLGPAALASHATAAFLWKLDRPGMGPPRSIDVTVARGVRGTVDGVQVHRTQRFPRTPGLRHQIPCTPVARTLLDLAGTVDERALELALDSAIRQYHATLIGIRQELDAAPSAPGAATLAHLAALRTQTGCTDSGLETDALRLIRLFGLPLPRTRFNIYDRRGRYVARPDFTWVDLRVAVFADSRLWHMHGETFERDRAQRTALEALDWRVLQITKRMVDSGAWLHHVQQVLELQRARLRAR
jgi:hypothetical protein